MNGHCSTCDVEQQCGYKYKPCDCCNYRKFTPKPEPYDPLPGPSQQAQIIQFPKKKDTP